MSTKTLTLIGDVHGKIEQYLSLISATTTPSIQLGDMGIGDAFLAPPSGVNLPFLNGHKFLRGNHDSPELCRQHPSYLGDFGYDDQTGIFWVGGAFSLDSERRLPSRSWWPDEELSQEQWERILADYERLKPDFVISHECPASANGRMLDSVVPKPVDGFDATVYHLGKRASSRTLTCVQMERMLQLHQPRRWAFGHYHVSWEGRIGRTQFFCLAELEVREFHL
jgi:Calcineurin-like phosphoesterase